MTNNANSLIICEPYPKSGVAEAVENTVQDNLNTPESSGERLERLRSDLRNMIRGGGVSGEYERAKRFRQAAFAFVGFAACAVALPRMAAWHAKQRTLIAPGCEEFRLDKYLNEEAIAAMPNPLLKATKSSYWLADSTQIVLNAMQQGTHPARDLYSYLDSANSEFYEAQREWKKGPGKNRWPHMFQVNTSDGQHSLIGAMCLNVRLANNLLAAKAVHHLIHTNPHADATELDGAIAAAVPRINWIASTDRHLGWRADWNNLPPGTHLDIMPADGVAALLQDPTRAIVEPNAFAASITGPPVMRDPDFCLHQLITDAPLAKAASCAGDPRATYPDNAERRHAAAFFAEMGFAPENGSYFNLSAVTLAMARRLLATEILPQYEAHRTK